MRVLVCGGRELNRREFVESALGSLHARYRFTMLCHGGAPGVDAAAAHWAWQEGISVVAFPADWSRGPRAGNHRNEEMLRGAKPDLVITFPGGRGTRDMIARAKDKGVWTLQVTTSNSLKELVPRGTLHPA